MHKAWGGFSETRRLWVSFRARILWRSGRKSSILYKRTEWWREAGRAIRALDGQGWARYGGPELEGRHPLMQEGMCHLFNNTDLCPYTTPASNCIFVRTSDASKLHKPTRT